MRGTLFLPTVIAASWLASSAATLINNSGSWHQLEPRQADLCGGDQTLSTCGNGRPSNWCCPQSSQCLSLNNTGTQAVLCCPKGSTCNSIEPISCDVKLQDASSFPGSAIHIDDLAISLSTCAGKCCPVGFDCQPGANGKSVCRAQENTFRAQASASSSSTSQAASRTSTVSGSTSRSSATSTAQRDAQSTARTPSGAVIAAIVVPILIGIILMGVGLFVCHRRSKKRRVISDPILDPQTAARSDFLGRRSPQLSITNRVSPMSGTILRAGTPDSVSPLAPHEQKFGAPPPRPIFIRPLPKAPIVASPELRNGGASQMATDVQHQQESSSYAPIAGSERSPIKGTMTSQHASGLYTLPTARYHPSI